MIEKGKTFLALLLVFCLTALPGNLAAKEPKGAKLSIIKTDGQEIAGELIAVRRDSLLLVNPVDGYDLTVNLNEIDTITVKNKSLMLELGVIGLLAGAFVKGLQHTERSTGSIQTGVEHEAGQQSQNLLPYAAVGAAIGIAAGAPFGIDKKIKIQGSSDAEIQEALAKLSKKAREPNFQ